LRTVPVIGLTSYHEEASWGVWRADAHLLPVAYSRSVRRAGGTPLLLPEVDDADSVAAILDRMHALILSGGRDLGPATYGAEADPHTDPPAAERDRFELALARGAVERDLPVLGICRGMQTLNVGLGGTLIQHLPDRLGSDRHRAKLGVFAEHDVRLEPGSLAVRASKSERVTVKSHHHQGVELLGEGVVASGFSEPDGLVEAIEVPGRRFALGVLWHCEEDERSALFGSLVGAVI
jgi:putative glutamine amidotransferase